MMGFLGDARPWMSAAHVLMVIAWMAGMLYLPRLFVYHADAAAGSDKSETFKIMERRLLRGIMNPAMILTLISGVALALDGGQFAQGWLHAKLLLVAAMLALHMAFARWRRVFADDRNARSARFFRIVNEVPAVALVVILILVFVRPF